MKILLCDDHEVFRSGLRVALAGFEAEIFEASCCQEALEIIASEDGIDLALLDLRMPGEDGFACLQTLRREHPEVGVVIVSASEEPADVRVALDGGALGFIPKSFPYSLSAPAVDYGQLPTAGILFPPQRMPIPAIFGSPPEALGREVGMNVYAPHVDSPEY